MKTLFQTLEIMSLASAYLGGIIGMITMATVGPWLGMLVQMYGGNTEPNQPQVAFPVVACVIAFGLPIAPAVKRRWLLAVVATIPLVLLPFWQLFRLYRAAA